MMTMGCFGRAGASTLILLPQPAAAQLEAIEGDLPPMFRETLQEEETRRQIQEQRLSEEWRRERNGSSG